MENSKKADAVAAFAEERPLVRRQFTPDALERVLIEELHLAHDVPLYIAYSGGLDSHVLLHALTRLREKMPWQLAALHIDHGLQKNSAAWSQHCARVCEALGVPFRSARVVVRDIESRGLEDAARQARYAVFAEALPAGAVLLTAHHEDDQAETMLLQLLRGAGISGLRAMRRNVKFARGRHVRPLLGFERRLLRDYAVAHGLQWIEDVSNCDERLARNFLRHRIWPLLTSRWKRATQRIALAARHVNEAALALDELGAIDMANVGTAEGELSIQRLLTLSAPRRSNVLRYWIRTNKLPTPSEAVLCHIVGHVEHCPESRHAIVRWKGGDVRRYRDRLVIGTSASTASESWQVDWNPSVVLEIPGSSWRLRAVPTTGAGVASSRIPKTLRVRLRRGGERFYWRGHHHKVKKLMQEAGIPPWERAHLPFIYVGEDLTAIGDRWICDPYAAKVGESGIKFVLEREAIC